MSEVLQTPVSRIAIPSYFSGLPERVAWQAEEATYVEYRRFEDSVHTQVRLDNHLLMMVLHGQKEVHTPHGDVIMGTGEGGIIKKGSYLMSSRRCTDDRYESLLFFLPTDLLQAFALEHAEALAKEPPAPAELVGFTFTVSDSIQQYLLSLVPFFKQPAAVPTPLLKLKLQELLWHLWLHHDVGATFRQFLAQLSSTAQHSVTELLEQNYLRKITLEDLAFLGGYSLSALKRACTKAFGVAPGQWLRVRRLEHARFLLQHTAANVGEVSDAVGYENLSHFVQAFKQQFGMTPGHCKADPKTT